MNTSERVKQISNYLLHSADERLINLVYSMIEEDREYDLSTEHKEILDRRLEARNSGFTISKSWEEVRNVYRKK